MNRFLESASRGPLHRFPEFVNAWRFVLEHEITDLDPWKILTEQEYIERRSSAINGRYPQRSIICFAERQDTDDVACLILDPGETERAGDVVILHDFASRGSEVDAEFGDFWEWLRAAVDDMIDTVRHM